MRFKSFEIRKPTYIGRKPPDDEYDIVRWADDNSYCWSIARLKWNPKEPQWEFESVGTRYLEDRESGLEEFILKYAELLYLKKQSENE